VTDNPDIVVLHTPRGSRALPVMRVIMGGVASRHDLPFERLDDIQLAVETLMAEESDEGEELVLTLSGGPRGFCVRLEGLHNQSLRAVLLATGPMQPCEGCQLDVRLFLDALVDSYQVVADAGDSFAVELEKWAS
jgi:hypothetical protein